MQELIKKYDEYIDLLGQEITEMASTASVHGWKSKREGKGKLLRKIIATLKNRVAQNSTSNNKAKLPLLCDACDVELPKQGNVYYCYGVFLCQACAAK